jgi:hypothetical protein
MLLLLYSVGAVGFLGPFRVYLLALTNYLQVC